jgi:thioesterase domain-containing protein
LLRRVGPSDGSRAIFALDPTFEKEMNMRLLLREAAPWVPSLDRDPVALQAPTVLLRTKLTAGDDPGWRTRCANLQIVEIPGDHQTLFEPPDVHSLHDAFVAATAEWRQKK